MGFIPKEAKDYIKKLPEIEKGLKESEENIKLIKSKIEFVENMVSVIFLILMKTNPEMKEDEAIKKLFIKIMDKMD